jgi:hypothetical protein
VGCHPLAHDVMSSPSTSRALEHQADRLYRRYGARPWAKLPDATREHFRRLVRAGLDGEGGTLA